MPTWGTCSSVPAGMCGRCGGIGRVSGGGPEATSVPGGLGTGPEETPAGPSIYLRRTNAQGEVTLLGRTWPVSVVWPSRLVRCEVDLDKDKIRFFTLRRKEPSSQPQILEVDYRLPNRGFQD